MIKPLLDWNNKPFYEFYHPPKLESQLQGRPATRNEIEEFVRGIEEEDGVPPGTYTEGRVPFDNYGDKDAAQESTSA